MNQDYTKGESIRRLKQARKAIRKHRNSESCRVILASLNQFIIDKQKKFHDEVKVKQMLYYQQWIKLQAAQAQAKRVFV